MTQTQKLKICMVVHLYYYRDVRVQRYADALVRQGVEVDVICVRSPDPILTQRTGPVNVYTIPLSHRPHDGYLSYLLEYTIACILYTLWLLVLHIRNRYQVIHVHNMPDFLVFTTLLPRLSGARIILDIHDPMPEFFMSKYGKAEDSKVARIMRLQEKLSTRYAQALITANSPFRANLIQRGIPPAKIVVVNNLPDRHIFDRSRFPSVPHDDFVLLYPGMIAARYGLEVAIRALPLIIPQIPNVRLMIVGQPNDHTTELTDLARQLEVRAYVDMRPLHPVEQIAQFMSQADVGIYPALSDPHMEIATPTKVLEYAAMGLPIVASRLGVLVDTFGDTALLLYPPGDSARFADCILKLYRDPALRRQLVSEADRVVVQGRTWEQEQRVYFDLLSHLVPRHAHLFTAGA